MKKNYFYLLFAMQRNLSLETATFLAALGYGLAILLLCVLR
jgi:hypothetical protein